MLGPCMIDIAGTTLTAEDRTLIQHPLVGGLIFFARNYETPAQIQALVQEIRAIKPDILLAVDQEGGRVQRFKSDMTRLPPVGILKALYARDVNTARRSAETLGWLMAAEILSLGIDISFAPVLDLDHGLSEIIGDRSFGTTPAMVTELAGAYIHGMLQAGMQPVGKHFPGHGAVKADSHLALPEDMRSLDEVTQWDMQPFLNLFSSGVSAIMTAHIVFPAVDTYPVTFSPLWLNTILRQQHQFDGVIFSDDLTMLGAATVGTVEARAVLALNAGCDMILICNQREAQLAVIRELEKISTEYSSTRLSRMQGKRTPAWLELQHNPHYQAAKTWVESLS